MPSENEDSRGSYSYWDYVSDAASVEAYRRGEVDPLLSAEALPETSSLIDFKAYAHEYPERLFPLLHHLRPEFEELFAEYYLLGKSQNFLAKAHGQIQTRIWQNLRIVERAVGALIVLGPKPDQSVLRPILIDAGLEKTEYGSLTDMIVLYAQSQSYKKVAKELNAPAPAIRKIFRPIIDTLLNSRDLKITVVGAYLRNLTHQASLTGGGLSKRCLARIRRVKNLTFDAPPADISPVLSFGNTAALKDTAWNMFEISPENKMSRIYPLLKKHGKRVFGKKAAQIFAPLDSDGELEIGYILARSSSPSMTRGLLRIRGISEMAARYTDEGTFLNAVTVPDKDVQQMINSRPAAKASKVEVGDFVEILTGEAEKYCGTVLRRRGLNSDVDISFPTGRHFTVHAASNALNVFPSTPMNRRAFWGVRV